MTYSKEHLRFLRKGYASMNTRDLTQVFNAKFGTEQTETAIKSALSNNGIKCGRKHGERLINRIRLYTPDQFSFLQEQYAKLRLEDLAGAFNEHFGLNRDILSIRACLRNHGITSGRTGCFEKSHKPWNIGTKGLTFRNSTTFKKGQKPPNRKPLGSERIDSKDGYILIKIKERNPYTGTPTRYKLKHQHVWEKKHGPIPAGMAVAFKDGDKRNCRIGNLMLISRAELLRLYKHGYKHAPDELKPTVLTLAKMEVKTFEISKRKKEAAQMEDLNELDKRTKTYHDAEDSLALFIRVMEDEIMEVTRRHMPTIKRRFEKAKEAWEWLRAEIISAPEVFDKPRTRTINGVTVGFKKEKGKVIIIDEEATIRRIEKSFSEDVAETLIKTTKRCIKKALQNLPAADLKKIGVNVEETGDKVVIALAASDVEKMIAAFRKKYMEDAEGDEEVEEAA